MGERELPTGWAYFTLGELAADKHNAIRRGPFGSAIKKAYFVPSGYKVYEQKNAIHGDFTLGSYYIDEERFEALRGFEVKSGDIIMSCSGTVGKLAVVPPTAEPGIINQALLKITLNMKAVSVKFFLLLLGFRVQEIVLQNTRGSAMVNIASVKILKALPFPIPPLPEQQRIVAEIETQFTRLEAGVAALKRAQANLRRYKASVLKAACEGRLVPTEAELARKEGRDYEPADVLLERILAERQATWEAENPRKKYKAPKPPDTSDLPELPEGWVWANLAQLKSFSLYGPRFSSKDYREEGRLVLRTSDISESGKVDLTKTPRLPLDDAKFTRYRCETGDVLVTRTGSLGTLAVFNDEVDAIPGAYLIQYRLIAPLITSWYVFYLFKSPGGQRYRSYKQTVGLQVAGTGT